MLSLPSSIRIFVDRDAADFRKAHDGLLAMIRDAFGDDPFDGSLFVFLNRGRDRVKLLQWDRDGFWLHYKRLEQGAFKVSVRQLRERPLAFARSPAMLAACAESRSERGRRAERTWPSGTQPSSSSRRRAG